jgi:hypothetical protein
MNKELHHEIRTLISDEKIIAIYKIAGSRPVAFSAIVKTIRHEKIATAVSQNQSARYTMCSLGIAERTERRHRRGK